MAERVIVADIGGTHARFAMAEVARGEVVALGEPLTLRTSDFDRLEAAWAAARSQLGEAPLAVLALAGPMRGEVVTLTNGGWHIARARLAERLGVAQVALLNDFEAVAHAVARLPDDAFTHIAGPDQPLSRHERITVLGPGTGLGVAHLRGREVQATEGAHLGFAPTDAFEDAVLVKLRAKYGRVSAERLVSGAGLRVIYNAMPPSPSGEGPGVGFLRPASSQRHHPTPTPPPGSSPGRALEGRGYDSDAELWNAALTGTEPLATAALDRFCAIFGSVAGDLALAHGASGVAIAGGLGQRLGAHLPRSEFAARFVAKGRYRGMMEAMPIRLVTHPQPGLYGAAAVAADQMETSK